MTIIKSFETEPIEDNWQSRKILLPAFIGLIMLILTEIWANNTAVTYGEKFENISDLHQALEMENKILENEIAKLSSLNNIVHTSAKLGLSKPSSVQYIP